MTSITMTEKETIVFGAFVNLIEADTSEEQKAEDEPIVATIDELATWTEMAAASLRPLCASLVKKGALFQDPEEKGTFGLTDEGIDFAFEAWIDAKKEGQEPEAAEAPAAPALDEGQVVENIKGQLRDALAAEGATKCSALRSVAAGSVTGRALFIQAAEAVGINRGTAARQWQEGRAEGGPQSPEARADLLTQLAEALADMAHDEIIATLTPTLTNKAIKGIIADLTEK